MIFYRLNLVIFCLFFSFTTFSQAYVGLKGGINRSKSTFFFNIDPSLVTNRGDLFGFYFGVPFEFEVNDFFNLMPEFAFVSEGSVISVQIQEEQRTYNNAIYYVKMPLVAKLKLLKLKNYEFGIIGGIVPAFVTDVKSYYFNNIDIRSSVNVPIKFEEAGIRHFDLGLIVGLNTEKVIAKEWKIIIDVRYNLGLIDIETHSNLTNTAESFILTIGLLTPIFKKKYLGS